MKKFIIIIFLAVFSSCSNFLNEYSQDQSYVRSYTDLDEMMIGNGYMKVNFQNYYFKSGYYSYIHVMGDDAQENHDFTDGSNDFASNIESMYGYYTWQKSVGINPEGTASEPEDGDWRRIYEHINIANMIIVSIEEQKATTDRERLEIARVKGEAHFLRAAYYFTLVNLYGKAYNKITSETDLGVPVKLTEYIEDISFKRHTVAQVYEQVVRDLTVAEECLTGNVTKSVYRADISAVNLLMSRVYLYMQRWSEAETYAQKVLTNKKELINLNGFNAEKPFLQATSPETIFSMGGSDMQYMFTENMKGFGVSRELYDTYDDSDLRKSIFFVSHEEVHLACVKMGSKGTTNTVSDNFLFRTAEAYLNLAEAAAMQGGKDKIAQDALNAVRKNRISSGEYEPNAETGETLVNSIRAERRLELCLEGHRWFDLRRYAVSDKYPFAKTLRSTYTIYKIDPVYQMFTPSESRVYELPAGDPAWVLPIPKEVMQFDPTFIQNAPRVVRKITETITY